jgi:hypothetical protein
MQKRTSLYIPTPCHEDWNKMTPTQQGKFCGSCNKHVVDFSLMSDQQILSFLSRQSGKLCGRFDADQLQRPLVETKIKKKKSWWMTLIMPLLFLFERSHAQGAVSIVKADTTVSPVDRQPQIMGKLIYPPIKEKTVTGKVVDDTNEPVPFATIIQKQINNAAITDSVGNFSIQINSIEDSVTLLVSAVGYYQTEKRIDMRDDQSDIHVIIKAAPMMAGEIVMVAVGLVVPRPIITIDTVKTKVKKILHISDFKTFPNPAIKGGRIYLELRQAGNYELQLLNDHSSLIKVEEISVASGKTTMPVQLPSNIAAGIYYLRLIDEKTKKTYTEKLLIQ